MAALLVSTRGFYPFGERISFSPFARICSVLQDERKTLDQLKDVPCLILLGSPSIGKSSEIGRWATALREQQQNQYKILDIELGGQTELTLNKELFTDQTYKYWLSGTHQLYLFLDGLDEGLLTIQSLTQWLSRKVILLPKPPDKDEAERTSF